MSISSPSEAADLIDLQSLQSGNNTTLDVIHRDPCGDFIPYQAPPSLASTYPRSQIRSKLWSTTSSTSSNISPSLHHDHTAVYETAHRRDFHRHDHTQNSPDHLEDLSSNGNLKRPDFIKEWLKVVRCSSPDDAACPDTHSPSSAPPVQRLTNSYNDNNLGQQRPRSTLRRHHDHVASIDASPQFQVDDLVFHLSSNGTSISWVSPSLLTPCEHGSIIAAAHSYSSSHPTMTGEHDSWFRKCNVYRIVRIHEYIVPLGETTDNDQKRQRMFYELEPDIGRDGRTKTPMVEGEKFLMHVQFEVGDRVRVLGDDEDDGVKMGRRRRSYKATVGLAWVEGWKRCYQVMTAGQRGFSRPREECVTSLSDGEGAGGDNQSEDNNVGDGFGRRGGIDYGRRKVGEGLIQERLD